MNKKILIIAIIAVLLIGGGIFFAIKNSNIQKEMTPGDTTYTTSKGNGNQNNVVNVENEPNKENNNKEEVKDMYSTGTHHATIEIKNYGTIKLELYADKAPKTVANFAKLVNEGFYNGLTFHRIIDGFMIQGGDPLGNGTGGSSETIIGEFQLNAIRNDISHVRGVISMARSTRYNSASSQFFIVHEDSTFLDGQYAGFGKVTEGIEIVDKICEDTQVEDDNGTVLKQNQPIIEKITMVD